MNSQSGYPLDSHSLIKAIAARPQLWNRNHPSHKDQDVVEKLWNEVSLIVESPKELLKSRWKGLRDTFRKEYKKPGISRWIHYRNLIFLEDMVRLEKDKTSKNGSNGGSEKQIILKKTPVKKKSDDNGVTAGSEDVSSNCDEGDVTNDDDNDESKSSFVPPAVVVTEVEETNSSAEPNVENSSKKRKITEGDESEVGSDLKGIWNNDVRYRDDGIDDDYHFFMSLIPHVKSLLPDQKLKLRMKMQEIIYEEICSSPSENSPSSN